MIFASWLEITVSYGRKIMKQNKAKLKLWQMLQSVRKVHNVKVLISLQVQKPFFSEGKAMLGWRRRHYYGCLLRIKVL